jgi:hypothetical protein
MVVTVNTSKSLSTDLVTVMDVYKSRYFPIHPQVKEVVHFKLEEKKIANVIQDALRR